MKNSMKVLASSSVTGLALASLMGATVFACTPKGSIIKYVQDTTTGSKMVDANTAADALTVHPGDTLVYTIVVGNNGGPSNDGVDDMINTKLTDTLPAGVTMADGSASNISADLGTVKEKKTVTKTYTVVVDKNATDGQVITNKGYTGQATNKDASQNQSGCDVAIVKVNVPTPPSTPTPPTTPTPPATPTTPTPPAELPNTGAGNFLLPAGLIGGLAYAGNLLRLKRAAKRA